VGLAHSPRVVTDGLVLALDAGNAKSYSGSGTTWTDISRNGNNGTLTNGPTYSNGSIVFDGTNDNVLITNPTTIKNQNFTISVWVNPGTQNASIVSIIDFDHASSPLQGWVLQSEDATTNRYFYLAWRGESSFQPSGGGGFGAGKGIQVTNSTWQNIVYSKNGTSLLGYLNGTQLYSGTSASSTVSYENNKNLMIGSCVAFSSRSFKGDISNTTIYNRALTASEIQQNFNALRGRFGI
jgi:hypothetical protein